MAIQRPKTKEHLRADAKNALEQAELLNAIADCLDAGDMKISEITAVLRKHCKPRSPKRRKNLKGRVTR